MIPCKRRDRIFDRPLQCSDRREPQEAVDESAHDDSERDSFGDPSPQREIFDGPEIAPIARDLAADQFCI